ncbi:unnamed protein product [Triticum turgidum subsp. durum]|uniref:C2H2-type domain-containing protein n=1 Tax=Triticum turgidum subsp. durum TaxID=4567 RepID=A0A9R0XM71_TRITD|nr:unnamed protein product [Triticum turgidum subsp. durum]
MGAGMKHTMEEEATVSLALSLSTDSAPSAGTSSDSGAGAPAKRRRGAVVVTSGEGEFVCKTCGRAFATFQALGGHRTSHLRGRHGLELGVGVTRAIKERKKREEKQHQCHIRLGFEMDQALGGHMRRHREQMALHGADYRWVALLPGQEVAGHHAAADQPPVLLDLFT